MSVIVYSITLCLFSTCKTNKTAIIYKGPKQNFENQGQQENYWAVDFFEKNYKKQVIKKYTGAIKHIDGSYEFDHTLISIAKSDSLYKQIFSQGLVYPAIIGDKKLSISEFEELPFLSNSPEVKRIRFLVWDGITTNPTVYFIELTNNKATEKTSLTEFLTNAKLTFIKQGWVQI